MGRPREFDTGDALENAMIAFWDRGYEGTSLQDLMTATGLRKQSLYGAFGNKKDIYIACLKHFEETRLRHSIRILEAPGTARERIGTLLQRVFDRTCNENDRSGCLLCNAAVDRAPVCEETGAVVDTYLTLFEDAFARALAASAPYDCNEELRKKHARAVLAAYLGLNVLAKGGATQSVLEDVLSTTLKTISPAH